MILEFRLTTIWANGICAKRRTSKSIHGHTGYFLAGAKPICSADRLNCYVVTQKKTEKYCILRLNVNTALKKREVQGKRFRLCTGKQWLCFCVMRTCRDMPKSWSKCIVTRSCPWFLFLLPNPLKWGSCVSRYKMPLSTGGSSLSYGAYCWWGWGGIYAELAGSKRWGIELGFQWRGSQWKNI